jgi:hypothetical protein
LGNSYIFVACHGGAQVEILEVDHKEFCVGGADGAVEDAFGCHQIGNFGRNVAGIGDFVAANGESDSVLIVGTFLGAMGGNDAYIGSLPVAGNVGLSYEVNGVASDGISIALGEAVEFAFVGANPLGAVAGSGEFGIFGYRAGVGIERIAVEGLVVSL